MRWFAVGLINRLKKALIDKCRGGKYFLFPDAQIAVVIKTSTGKK